MRFAGSFASRAMLLTAIACTRVPTGAERLEQVSTAIRLERIGDALDGLDSLEREPGSAIVDRCKLLELRLVALAGRGRPDDLQPTLQSLIAACRGAVTPSLVARTGAMLLDAGASLPDVESLFAVVPDLDQDAGSRVGDFLAARAAARDHPWQTFGLTEAQEQALMRFDCDFAALATNTPTR